jgi:histidinol dehydrogenase
VATAKRLLYGQVGIDFIAGPTDVLIIADDHTTINLLVADMLAQAEHDPDASARVLVANQEYAAKLATALYEQSKHVPATKPSLDSNGLIVVYNTPAQACRIANIIAPEHLELLVLDTDQWLPFLHQYGSLFIGSLAAEVIGDYSAGINHTLPTSGAARFTGGLSVRHFLKTVTTLRCVPGTGFDEACQAAETIARAEGLTAHAESVGYRISGIQ